MDEISSAGAVLRNNTFTHTACNLGRFKSPHGYITGNTFSDASLWNLELTSLLPWFEGPIVLDGIQVNDNVFAGVGADPIHCGPLCEMSVVRGGEKTACWELSANGGVPCSGCPDCSKPTAWASAGLGNNTYLP